MRNLLPSLPLLALALASCRGDPAVPTGEDNRAMDAAASRLDNAANALDSVDERLPETDNAAAANR